MRTMPAPAAFPPVAYQAALDLLCLSVPTSPLVQDFVRVMSFIALLAGRSTEPMDLSAMHHNVSLTHSMEMRLVLELA